MKNVQVQYSNSHCCLKTTNVLQLADLINITKNRCSLSFINNDNKLHEYFKLFKVPKCPQQVQNCFEPPEGNTSRVRRRQALCFQEKYQYEDEFVISNPCLITLNLNFLGKQLLNSQPFKKDHENPELQKLLPNIRLQNERATLNVSYKIAEEKGRQFFLLVASPNSTLKYIPLIKNDLPIYPYNVLHYRTKQSMNVQLPELRYSICSFFTSLGSILEKPISMEQIKKGHHSTARCHGQASLSTHPFSLGPFAQTQVVYNVMEQTNTQMKEKGTSQQFKQKSQGIGSASVSGNDSSSASSSKRRTIRIESGVSFSVEFIDRGKSVSTVSPSEPSSQEPVAEPIKKKGKEKKELHRCQCTMSIPTDDKKLKNKPCDSGVCEPGKCTPSECFRRLQEKYGSKKKSGSDISSSQGSQVSKKKAKAERAGKEIVVKEQGSSSISKYKESTEIKPLPKPEEKEKFNIGTCMTNCCNKLQFWKKDKTIELKPAVIGTDISVKDDKAFGSSTATQAGKTKDEKKKSKETSKTTTEKKGKKATEKDDKGAEGDKKAKDKKTGKDAKGKKEEDKKSPKKGKKEEVQKAPEKGKKGEDKKSPKKGKKEEVQKAPEKGKKGEVKKPPEMGKQKKEKESKKEKKAADKTTKTGRPLKPYECEPGVCSPKVCSPKECYERKFPPPPPKTQEIVQKTKFQKCLDKLCCKKPATEAKPVGVGGVSAATQSRKSTVAPEIAPGTPVYKETSSSPRKRGQVIDTGVQLPVDAGDVQIDSRKTKKHTAYSGMQFFQTVDQDAMTQRQGLNIGSECSCSVELYKMLY